MLSWLTLRKENRETLEKDVNRQIVNRIRLKKKMLCMEYFYFMTICILFNVSCLFYQLFETVFSSNSYLFSKLKDTGYKGATKTKKQTKWRQRNSFGIGKETFQRTGSQ